MFGNQVIQVAGAHICNTRVLAKMKTTNKKITTSAAEEGAQWPKALQAFDLLAALQVPRNAPWTNARIFGWGWLRHQNQGMWAAYIPTEVHSTNGGERRHHQVAVETFTNANICIRRTARGCCQELWTSMFLSDLGAPGPHIQHHWQHLLASIWNQDVFLAQRTFGIAGVYHHSRQI